MKISIDSYGTTYEIITKQDDYDAGELKEMFSRLLVLAGYPPSVMVDKDDSGIYAWLENDETIIKMPLLDELKNLREENRELKKQLDALTPPEETISLKENPVPVVENLTEGSPTEDAPAESTEPNPLPAAPAPQLVAETDINEEDKYPF